MTVIALTSAKGSPGVTTTALALAWAWPQVAPGRRVLVVDADMAGGDLAPGYLRGAVSSNDGVLGLAAARPADLGTGLWDHLIAVDESATILLLTGISDPAQARSLTGVWPSLAEVFTDPDGELAGVDVLVDLGRVGTANEAAALRARADLMLLVLRSSLRASAAARAAGRRLVEERDATTGGIDSLGCVVVAEGQPYSSGEIATAVGLPVRARVAWDPTSAAVLSDGAAASWRFARSPLMRSAAACATDLLGHASARASTIPAIPAPVVTANHRAGATP
jgi:hypothetical protein